MTANHNYMVRRSIIAQYDLPNRAPEIILPGMDDLSVVIEYRKLTPNQSSNNQHLGPCQHQTYTIFHDSYWQQFIANKSFHLQYIIK